MMVSKRGHDTGIKIPALVILRITMFLVINKVHEIVECSRTSTFEGEVKALLEFKGNFINKTSQHLLESWTVDSNSHQNKSARTELAARVCGSWVGVACNQSSLMGKYHIWALSLPQMGLKGSLAPHLGNLSFLVILDLSTNEFTGSIPTQLMGCTSLQALNLSNNMLSGAIPSSLTALPSLVSLLLGRNSLTGPIPSALFTNMSASFLELSLHNNGLTGSIPPDPCLHQPNLLHLFLWQNNLTGSIPPSFANFTKLVDLVLSANQLTGPLPPELGLLSNLQTLSLDSNSLTGPIPPSLGNCTQLSTLFLDSNPLTGPIPTELGSLRAATFLSMYQNHLTGDIPPNLGNCTSLIHLQIGSNRNIRGVIPMELGLLGKTLQCLYLASNSLTGVIPSSLANCTNLTALHLSDNQLRGSIPSEFKELVHLQQLSLNQNCLSGLLQLFDPSNLTSLMRLWLQANQLSGSLSLMDFSRSQQLQDLTLSNNHQITGEIPWDSFTNSTPRLYNLDLSNNQLSGTGFPSTLGKLRQLKHLYLQGNWLRGGIPEFANLHNLGLLDLDMSLNYLDGSLPPSLAPALRSLVGRLNLSHNSFSGSLPPWLGELAMVTTIDLSNNKFTGSIPGSLGDCTALTALDLSHNNLSGNLSANLGNASYLQILDLSYNNLSGVLPSFLGTTLPHLQLLNVSFNNFTGAIPTDEGVFKLSDASCFQGNPGLCGPVLKKECIYFLQAEHRHLHLMRNWRGGLLITSVLLSVGAVGLLLVLAAKHYNCAIAKLPADVHMVTSSLAEAKRYSAKVLMEATQGYSQLNILGQGGLGVVYKGVLPDGKVVAVKKLKDVYNGLLEQLLQEMRILSRLKHRNLVQILGCVLNLETKAVVLQYMPRGSLEHYLDNVQQFMDHINVSREENQLNGSASHWEMVMRVAMGVAHALAYLHHEFGTAIIHGDVKPGNILLDADLEPHLADFGLAKLIDRGAEAISLTSECFKGSIGYMAPEYAYAARITTKVDVYSYGVVLLRMLTGRSPIMEGDLAGQSSLHDWAKLKLAALAEADVDDIANWGELLDAALVQEMINSQAASRAAADATRSVSSTSLYYNQQQVRLAVVLQLLRVSLSCTEYHPADRPTIQEVLYALHIVRQQIMSHTTQ